jgi:glycosyltransferase involved in cell wall biosynthesis
VKFSVIIPTFNRGEVLSRAVNSVLSQTFKDFELLIIDDGSTDQTEQYLNHVLAKDKRVKCLQAGAPGGPLGVSIARNRAARVARGEYLAFLDSDDEWLPHKLESQNNWFEQNPAAPPIVHGQERWVRNGVRVNPMKKHSKGGGDQFLPSLKLCVVSPSTVCLSKKLFWEMGGFREDFPVCEDYDLWLKITSLMPIGFIENDLIIKYGGHSDQLSRSEIMMDRFRVRSIDWVLNNRNLVPEQRGQALSVLMKKTKILIKGMEKHRNYLYYEEMRDLYDRYAALIDS